jgi:glycosyltransferase involved in cell wall biosynthesis
MLAVNFILIRADKNGGTRVVFSLANELAKKNVKVTILALAGNYKWFNLKVKVIYPDNRLLKNLFRLLLLRRFDDSPYYYLDLVLRNRLNVNIDILKLLADFTPDCDYNIGNSYLTIFSAYLSNKGLPIYYIMGPQDVEIYARKDEYPYHKNLALASYYLPVKRIVVSKYLFDYMLKFNIKPDAIVPNGVDTTIFKPCKRKEDNLILGIWRNVWFKGSDDMLKLFSILHKKDPSLKFLVIGRPDKKLIKKYDLEKCLNIVESPNDEQLAKIYSSASIYVSTSYIEGFGLPALEAMACGTPPVMFDSGGIYEYAINGYNSIIIKNRNIELMAEKILELLKNQTLYNEIRNNGMQTAKNFQWEKTADRFLEVLKKFKEEKLHE